MCRPMAYKLQFMGFQCHLTRMVLCIKIYVNFIYKAQLKRRSFHVTDLIPFIKYKKTATFESIKCDVSNLGRPMN